MASYSDILFGRIVLKNRLASYDAVQQCLDQARGQTLGEVLVGRGVISAEQARDVQRAQALMQFVRAEKIFAKILAEKGLVELGTLRKAFEVQEQQRHGVRLAQILMERNLLSPVDNERVVDEQLVQLAEETERIEFEGLRGAATSGAHPPIDALARVEEAEDLANSTMKRALGPRGLLDAPRAPLQRTMPVMVVPTVDEDGHASPFRGPGPNGGQQRPVTPDDLVGTTLASRYRVLEKIGEGGMGTVYKAEHCLMEKIVAIKVLHPSLLTSPTSLERFRTEIRAASRFQHRNVIQIYDAGEGEGGIFYMAMEYATGETLEDLLQRGPLPQERGLDLFRQTLRAVGEAHKLNIVHRDLKSGNIIVTRDKDGRDLAKVMDFGIAKIAFDEQEAQGSGPAGGGLYRTQEGIVTGTPQYMSPEQASGEKVDHRSDLYSLGVIFFEVLTGQLPFRSDTPMGYLGKHIVSPAPAPSSMAQGQPIAPILDEIVLRLLEKDPGDRYQTAEEIGHELDHRCSPAQLAASSVSQVTPGPRPFAPTIPVQPVAKLEELEEPPPVERPPPPPAKKGQALILGGLAVMLLLALTLSTTLALVLQGDDSETPVSDGGREGEAEILARARALLASDPSAAAQLVAPLAARLPEAKQLLEEATQAARQRDEASGLVRSAEDLVSRFEQGMAGREALQKAIDHYQLALDLHDDPRMRARHRELEEKLQVLLTPEPDPVDTRAERGRALLAQVEAAILERKLAEAESLLREVEQLLPGDDPELQSQGRYLEAERHRAAAKRARAADRLEEARRELAQAARLHHDKRVQASIQRELEEVEAELGRRAHQESVGKHLVTTREALLRLDLEAAARALDEAAAGAEELGSAAGELELRRRCLDGLRGFAPAWRRLREGLAGLAQGDPQPERAREVQSGLRALRPQLEALESADPELIGELGRQLEAELAQATELVTQLEAAAEAAKSAQLRRFERKLQKIRERSDPVESYDWVSERLEELEGLTVHPSYRSGECSSEDKEWIATREAFLLDRFEVWRDLGRDMVQVPGGSWTSPGGTTYELPAVYYVAVTEVTCKQWQDFLKATGRKRPAKFPGPTEDPMCRITIGAAKSYLRWRSKNAAGKERRVVFRLPSEGEWERAARADSAQAYPWGGDFDDWREEHAAVGGKLMRVRSFPKDRNAWGLWDLVGNVQEMTSTVRDGKIVLCGGSIATTRSNAHLGARKEAPRGSEAASYVGLRVFAVERE